jgi:hypothetical protein
MSLAETRTSDFYRDCHRRLAAREADRTIIQFAAACAARQLAADIERRAPKELEL